MTTPNDPTMSHDSLDAAIAGYLLAVEAGDVPNRQEWLERHPEHADALRTFFADLDRIDRVASPLRLAGGLEDTGDTEANGRTAPPAIRYFGDYKLLEEIARGGMGIVYKARQVSLNRLVAFAMAERRGRLRAEQAEDRLERTFAQSLARPLDPNGDGEEHGTGRGATRTPSPGVSSPMAARRGPAGWPGWQRPAQGSKG